ncbi:MAG: ABC transporter ATP-binding protein [Erysipelotrichaceae bacterium]
MSIIHIENLTRDYNDNKGIFNISFDINEGEVFGFLGPNGAGKTTTIRHLLGFLKAREGKVEINGLDVWNNHDKLLENVGYIPGEIAFFDNMTGLEYLKFIHAYRKDKQNRMDELIRMFDLNPKVKIRKMSKGMKQKVGIVAAFMHNPSILILDEPTSGLDPLMQQKFIELIDSEKKRGKTILLSSHMFEEVERTCDRIGIIRNGHLVALDSVEELRKQYVHTYEVTLSDEKEAIAFAKDFSGTRDGLKVKISSKESLEDIFMKYYDGGQDNA